jgi:hypothetical protein
MMFLLTLNMKSSTGRDIHQVIVEHPPSKSCADLARHLQTSDFLVCRELYVMSGQLIDRGELIVSSVLVGKAKQYVENPHYA